MKYQVRFNQCIVIDDAKDDNDAIDKAIELVAGDSEIMMPHNMEIEAEEI